MKNLKIKASYLLVVLFLLAIPIFKKADAQFIDISKDEIVDVPMAGVNDNQPIDFSINKKEFTAGEKIEIKAVFQNQTQQSLAGRMIIIISSLDKSFPAKSFLKEFDLSAGEKTEDFISEMKIEDWMPVGIYQAEIEIRDKNDHSIYKKSEFFETFQEEKIDNEIEAAVQVCANEDCSIEKMVFGKNETVYFKLNASVQNLKINATIKTPDEKIEILNFENDIISYPLVSAEEGKYSLWVNFSKENYKNRRIEKKFIFEEEYTEEIFESVCKIDGKCEGEEDKINCPKDCNLKSEIRNDENSNKIFYYAIYFIIFVIVVFAIKMYVNKRNSSKAI